MANDDRRAFERFNARFPVKLKDTRDDFGTNVFLRDASAEGARVASRERMFLNDYISITVKLPDGFEPLTLNGRVTCIKTVEPNTLWDIGVKFHKVELMKLQRLYRLIEQE